MSGILGDFLVFIGPSVPQSLSVLGDSTHWPPLKAGGEVRFEQPCAGVQTWTRGDAKVFGADMTCGGLGLALEPQHGEARAAAGDPRQAAIGTWRDEGQCDLSAFKGRYSYVFWSENGQRIRACTDTFGPVRFSTRRQLRVCSSQATCV